MRGPGRYPKNSGWSDGPTLRARRWLAVPGGAVLLSTVLVGTACSDLVQSETSGTTTSGSSTTSGDSGPTGLDTSSSGDATTGMPQGSSTSVASTDDGTSTTTGESSSTGPVPRQEVLQTAGMTECNLPLWCFEPGDLFTPTGGPIWLQECFTATLPPPFELIEIETTIRGLHEDLTTVAIEIYRHDPMALAGPTDLLVSQVIDSSTLVVGPNTIPVDPPILINESDICIGFVAPEKGLASALGVATDMESELPDRSYVRSLGECDFPDWFDATTDPTFTGNWCIAATIQEFI